MAGEDFTIETKLKIAGVVATGNLDAGTLKFNVDTSALKKLVKDAAISAKAVRDQFNNIKLNKIKVEINQASLRQIESQIRGAIKNAVGKAKVVIETSLGKGEKDNPFKAQRIEARGAAEALKTMHALTKDVNQGLRSLITTLSKLGTFGPSKPVIQANAPAQGGLPIPPGARTISTADIGKEISQIKQLGAADDQVTQQRLKNAEKMATEFAKTEQKRLSRIQKLKSEMDELFRKEQQLASNLSGGAAGGGGGGGRFGGGPPGSFGSGGAGGGDFGRSKGSVQDLARAMEDVTKNTKAASNSMIELDELTFQVGRKAATFRGVAIAINTVINSTVAAAKFVIQYNDSLLELNKILQSDKQILQVVGDNLFEIAKTTGVAVDQTIAIATEFARAGLEGRGYGNVVELTNKALLGLQGTSLDANQATEIIIQTIQQVESGARGLNKELITTSKLFDILGRAEDITASKASDIQEAFKRSLASLTATGSTMEELVSIISVLQERTQRGGDVIGTALKTLASRISSSSSEASQALKAIGVATVDSEGKLRNIFDVLRDTSIAFKNLSETEQANIAVKAAGIRQVEIFRAALLDFNRVQEVQNDIAASSGDAARKQKVEQEKLGNTINRITIALQQLVKTASEGTLGKLFVFAVDTVEKLVTGLSNADKVLGGMLSTFALGAVAIGGIKILIPLVKGINKAFQYFLGLQKESSGQMTTLNTQTGSVANTIKGGLNTSLQSTALIMNELNAQMTRFQQQTELAATKAQRLAKAREMAVREFGATGKQPTDQQVNSRTAQILKSQEREQNRARSFAILSAEQSGKGNDLAGAVRSNPEQFTEAERKRILAMEKDISRSRGRIVTSFEAIGGTLGRLAKNPLVQGVGLSLLAGGLDSLAEKTESTALKIASTAAQFAGFGAILGGLGGAGIGAVIGLVTAGFSALSDQLKQNSLTVEELGKRYAQLGLIQTENGKIGVDAAQRIQVAFDNIQELQSFSLKQKETQSDVGGSARRQSNIDGAAQALVASLDRTASAEENRRRVLESATAALQSQTGSKFKIQDETLKAGSEALKQVTAKEFDAVIDALVAITPENAKSRIEKQARDLYDQAANLLSPDELKKRKGALHQRQTEFADQIEQLLPTDNIVNRRANKPFAGALGQLSQGFESEDVQKAITRALTGAARGNGPTGAGGIGLSVDQVSRAIAQARTLGGESRQVERGGLGRAGGALSAALEKLPLEIKKAVIEAQNENAQRQRATQLASQLDAFDNIASEMISSSRQVVKGIGQPVDKLQLALRNFIADFSTEVIRLNEATLNATTPQKELATRLREFSEVRLKAATERGGLEATDAILDFRNAINQSVEGLERVIGRDAKGNALPGFSEEEANRTVGDAVKELSQGLLQAVETIRKEGITGPSDQRRVLEQALPKTNVRDAIGEEAINTIVDNAKKLGDKLIHLDTDVAEERLRVNRAKVDELKFLLSEQEKEIGISRQRREISAQNARALIEELSGIRQLVGIRKVEAEQTLANIAESQNRIKSFEKLIAAERAVIAANKDDAAAKDKLAILQEEKTRESIALEELLANERIANIKQTLAIAQEAISAGQKEADFQRSMIAGRGDLIDLLIVGEKQIDQFNRKLEQNAESFRTTQAALAAETSIVNATITDGAEKEARLADIRKRGALAALDAAKAEAQVIAERRAAIQQVVQEALANEQEQVNAQKAVIDATKTLSDAYISYREAIQGAILATTQYNLNLRLAEVQTVKLTGGFTGVKDQLSAVTDAFKAAESMARNVGASERTLTEIRKQSIDQQLALFNQLLNEQSNLAKTFFQSSAEDQASLFQGIQQAQGVADLLGGSFDNFKKLGESAINDLGAQLLALPQETRQQVVRSIETLGQLGGGSIGGFTPDQLLTAIETASLGVSEEGLDVDPLFEVQKHIASLTEQQALIATDQLLAAQQQVEQAKQQLTEAQAAKDLAKIQLDRLKEEGSALRGKIAELNADLRTVLLQQDTNAKNGFNMVTGVIARTNDIITNTLPDALSVKIAQAFRDVLATGGLTVPGLTAPQQQNFATPQDRGAEMAQNFRREGSNAALQQQIASQAGLAPGIVSRAFGNAQEQNSNLPDSSSSKETNQRLSDVVSELKSISNLTTTNNEVLTEIRDSAGTAVGTASATVGGTATAPEITININGEQRITVTGFEAGVTRIATALNETFGGFATEAEAREIANQVVEAIRLELQRLGILQRNQL